MSSFNEALTQIRELEERAVEELKEIIQVGSCPVKRGAGNTPWHSRWSVEKHRHLSRILGLRAGAIVHAREMGNVTE